MGTSGTSLYSDDTACGVRDEFLQLLAQLRDPARATASLVQSWNAQLADIDEGPVFWLALAETQWKYGCLEQTVKAKAILVIDEDQDLHRWEGADLKRRRVTLVALKEKLLSQQPKLRLPKARRAIELPSLKVLSPNGLALATAYPLASDTHPNSPKMQVLVEMLSSGSRGGGGVFLATCEYTDIQLSWLDPETLKITYPTTSVVVQQSASTFYYGRTIQIVYRARDA